MLSCGREMAFFMMGETSGGGDDDDTSRCLATEFFRPWRNVRVKKPAVLELLAESGLPGSLAAPKLLRKEVSPNTSPPRPTCMVCRKSPKGGLIMSTESSLLKRRFPWEPGTRPFIPGSLPRLMARGKWLQSGLNSIGSFLFVLKYQSSSNSSRDCTVKKKKKKRSKCK